MNINILSNLIIREFCSATTMHTLKNTKGGYIDRPRWAIIIKHSGETKYICNEKSYVSNINNMVILPKGCNYEWICTESGNFSAIEFDSDSRCKDIMHFPIKNGAEILNQFKEIEYKITMHNMHCKLEAIRDIYSIILKLLKSESKKYTPNYKLQKIMPSVEYIAKNYNKTITNDMLANICGISTVYFRKLFGEVYGVSPIAHIHSIRIKKAKEMLRSDYGSITDIASSLGYTSIYDFSRAFKKHTGLSPTKYITERPPMVELN